MKWMKIKVSKSSKSVVDAHTWHVRDGYSGHKRLRLEQALWA